MWPDKGAIKQGKLQKPSSFTLLQDKGEEMGNETPDDESPPGRMKAAAEKHQQKEKTDKTLSMTVFSSLFFCSLLFIELKPIIVWPLSLILVLIGRQWLQSNVLAEEDTSF